MKNHYAKFIFTAKESNVLKFVDKNIHVSVKNMFIGIDYWNIVDIFVFEIEKAYFIRLSILKISIFIVVVVSWKIVIEWSFIWEHRFRIWIICDLHDLNHRLCDDLSDDIIELSSLLFAEIERLSLTLLINLILNIKRIHHI